MKSKLKVIGFGVLFFGLVWIAIGFLLTFPAVHGLYETLETYIYSQLFVSTATPTDNLIIIDEGDKEFQRDAYASLISGLDKANAKVIALDILFSAEMCNEQNHQLVTAIQKSADRVILGVEFIDSDNQPMPFPSFHVASVESPNDFVEAKGALLPFSDLRSLAKNFAHINRTADETLREAQHYPLFIKYNNRLYPSLPLLSVANFLDCRIELTPEGVAEAITLVSNETHSTVHAIPINIRGQMLINFLQMEAFAGKIISFEKALTILENQQYSEFHDKIVLVGNSFDAQEQWPGPGSNHYPSLIVIGTVISQILNDQYIVHGIGEGILFSIVMSIVMLAAIYRIVRYLEFKFPQRNSCQLVLLYLLCIVPFLVAAKTAMSLGTKLPVILPYFAFAITTPLTKRFIDSRRILVFVSYAVEDEAFAKKLESSMQEKYNIKLWLFQTSLRPGDRWKRKTHAAILRSSKFLLILSPDSVKSQFVLFERVTAELHGRPIIPVLFRPCEIPPDIISERQVSDFTKMENYDSKVEELGRVFASRQSSHG